MLTTYNDLSSSGFLTNQDVAHFFIFVMRAAWPMHHILVDLSLNNTLQGVQSTCKKFIL